MWCSESSVILNRYASQRGRCLVVGDIHGEMEMLERLLSLAGYNERSDTLIALGDMVDRGPNSREVLDFFATDSVLRVSLMGNHEAMMLQSREHYEFAQIWRRNGGRWADDLDANRGYLYRCMLRGLPLTAEIRFEEGLTVGLVHAEVPPGTPWARMRNVRLNPRDGYNDWAETAAVSAIWGRRRFKADVAMRNLHPIDVNAATKVRVWRNAQPVKGVDLVICGHTVIDDHLPRGRGNVLWIETGAAYGGQLTLVDPLARTYWQVGHGIDQKWGPLPLPEHGPLPPEWRPTRRERAQAKVDSALAEERRAFAPFGYM